MRTGPLDNAVQKLRVADGISKRPQSYRSHCVGWRWGVFVERREMEGKHVLPVFPTSRAGKLALLSLASSVLCSPEGARCG